MKYIDVEKLKTEIEKRINYQRDCIKNDYRLSGKAEEEIIFEYGILLRIINSLQQERPEVDFEKEYAKFSNDPNAMNYAFPIDLADYKDFARHFYELGLNARKEDKK